ncbi:MAG TPA: hypothetical protein VHW60_15140 [Caulobacteraceae bacterium]|jgi:hypothetical protein|nr:hypothetical protein [Caulobacteraceae bacterium]
MNDSFIIPLETRHVERAFAVYVIHVPILVALAVAMAPIALAPVAKFVVL